jgi:hypothetical protein
MMFWIVCPRCNENGKLKVMRTKPTNPNWYGAVLHFENEGFPHGKITNTCYLGKVINNAVHCSFSADIIELPNFNEQISLENELIEFKDDFKDDLVFAWCDAKDCEHNLGSGCGGGDIEIRKGKCMSFSRRKDWVDRI